MGGWITDRGPVRWRKVLAAGMAGTVLAVAVGGGTASAAPPAPDRSPAGVLQRGLDDLHGLGITGVQGQGRGGDRVTRARTGVAHLRTGAPMPLHAAFRLGH